MAKAIRPMVFERDGYQCRECGSCESLEVDHILSIAVGGSNDFDNLQTLCRRCNRSKGAN